MATSRGSGWAWLPELALNLILHKLLCLPDCVRFASVCASWRVAAKNAGNKQFPVPMLLVPITDTSNRDKIAKTSLYSVQENKTYNNVELHLDDNTFRFCGSSHGWLSIVEPDFSITLSSPTRKSPPQQRSTLRLPPITNIDDLCLGLPSDFQQGIQETIHFSPQLCVHKVVLSANPTATRDYVVVAIYGIRQQLAILRSGDDEGWTYLDRSFGIFSDAAWHESKLYAVTQHGDVMRIDGVTSKNLSPSIVYSYNYAHDSFPRFYLVGSSRGELLLAERYFDPTRQDRGDRSVFKVHRLEMSPVEEERRKIVPKVWPVGGFVLLRVSGKANRVEVKEMGGDALFLGSNFSAAVAASEMCPSRGNCIHYTEELEDDDMGMFYLENGRFETHYSPNPPDTIMPPIWFTPVLSDWV